MIWIHFIFWISCMRYENHWQIWVRLIWQYNKHTILMTTRSFHFSGRLEGCTKIGFCYVFLAFSCNSIVFSLNKVRLPQFCQIKNFMGCSYGGSKQKQWLRAGGGSDFFQKKRGSWHTIIMCHYIRTTMIQLFLSL